MPYLNLDDEFAENNEHLSDAAFRLHVAGLCFSARKLTDGHLTTSQARRLVPGFKAASLRELVNAGAWVEAPGGYQIKNYLKWNRSREWWESRRKGEAARLVEYRAKRKRQLKVVPDS